MLFHPLSLIFFEKHNEWHGNDEVYEQPGEKYDEFFEHWAQFRVSLKAIIHLEQNNWQQLSRAFLKENDSETNGEHFKATYCVSQLERLI